MKGLKNGTKYLNKMPAFSKESTRFPLVLQAYSTIVHVHYAWQDSTFFLLILLYYQQIPLYLFSLTHSLHSEQFFFSFFIFLLIFGFIMACKRTMLRAAATLTLSQHRSNEKGVIIINRTSTAKKATRCTPTFFKWSSTHLKKKKNEGCWRKEEEWVIRRKEEEKRKKRKFLRHDGLLAGCTWLDD